MQKVYTTYFLKKWVKAKNPEWPDQCCKSLEDQYPNIAAKVTVDIRKTSIKYK